MERRRTLLACGLCAELFFRNTEPKLDWGSREVRRGAMVTLNRNENVARPMAGSRAELACGNLADTDVVLDRRDGECTVGDSAGAVEAPRLRQQPPSGAGVSGDFLAAVGAERGSRL